MSLRPNTIITIEQQPNNAVPNRVLNTYTLDFVNSVEIVSSWQNLTDTAKIKIPRSIYIEDEQGNKFPLAGGYTSTDGYMPNTGTAIYETFGNKQPVILRGDKVTIELGYWVDDMMGGEQLQMPDEPQFVGYITKIKNRAPIEIECEDEMWQLKKINTPNKLFKGSTYTVQKMLREMLDMYFKSIGKANPYTVAENANISTNVGDFRTQNETVAMVLERLRKDGGLYSYFRDKELRCSGIVYYPKDIAKQEVFEFQENIISDSLEYTRKEDLNIAVKAIAQNISSPGTFNADGTEKSKRKRIEVVVGLNAKGQITELNAKDNFHGDLITFPVLSSNFITHDELLKRAKEYLPKFYYTGFRGSFNAFCIPFVKHGNAVILRNNVTPEMAGTYLIKQVTIHGGMSGHHQTILLHLRIDKGFTQDQLNIGI